MDKQKDIKAAIPLLKDIATAEKEFHFISEAHDALSNLMLLNPVIFTEHDKNKMKDIMSILLIFIQHYDSLLDNLDEELGHYDISDEDYDELFTKFYMEEL